MWATGLIGLAILNSGSLGRVATSVCVVAVSAYAITRETVDGMLDLEFQREQNFRGICSNCRK